jgi:hypothetical protein
VAKIAVHIEADNTADFRATLQELLSGAATEAPAALEPVKPAKTKKAVEKKPPEPVDTEETAPIAAAPVAETQEVPAADPESATGKTYTQEELRKAIQVLRGTVARQLVAEFSGNALEPKLSDVPAEKHAELVAEVQRLAQLPENVKQGATNE